MKRFFTYADPIVPAHHPRTLVETAVAFGADRSSVLEGSDITPEMLGNPDARFSYFQFGRITANALRLTGEPALGIEVGRRIGLPQMGVLGLALMSSATVGAALDVALRYYRSVAPAWEIELRVEGSTASLVIEEALPLTPFRAFATEALLVALDTQGTVLLRKKLPAKAMGFAYERPPYADRYREIHDVPIVWNQKATFIDFDSAALDIPLPTADPATADLATRQLAQSLPPSPHAAGLVGQMRDLLRTYTGPPPDVTQVARRLQTSSRSLRRYLREMGTSYRELLDEAQRDRAEQLARGTSMPFDRIAEILGFSGIRSFRRAFKRWTGSQPTEYRSRPR